MTINFYTVHLSRTYRAVINCESTFIIGFWKI